MMVTRGLAHTGFRFLLDNAFAQEVRIFSSQKFVLTLPSRWQVIEEFKKGN
jgi:hypothetical protein